MRYATLNDLQARFGEAELRERTDPDAQAINEAAVERALDDAHADADGALALVYVLPLAGCTKPAPVPGDVQATVQVAPPQLTRWVCDLARAYLWQNELLPDEHPIAQAAQAARRQLQLVASGKLAISCPWGGQAGQTKSGQADASTAGETWFDFSQRRVRHESDSYR